MSQQCQHCLQKLLFYYCFKTNCYMNQSNRLSLIPLICIDYHCALISIPATCLHRFKNVKDTFSNFVRGELLCWLVSGVWYLLFGIWYLVFQIWYLVFGIQIWYLVFRFGIWYLIFQIWYLDLVFWCFSLDKLLQALSGCRTLQSSVKLGLRSAGEPCPTASPSKEVT